jgi:hypothetical protein
VPERAVVPSSATDRAYDRLSSQALVATQLANGIGIIFRVKN